MKAKLLVSTAFLAAASPMNITGWTESVPKKIARRW